MCASCEARCPKDFKFRTARPMSVNPFFDSNVLLYLASNDVAKANRAEALLADGGTISVQCSTKFECGS